MIYVDALIPWSQRATGGGAARRIFGEGKLSCHLTTDGPLEELHAFAARLGLRREWYQDHPRLPHYDLTPRRRAAAVALGARECTRRELVAMMRARRAAAAP